MNLANTLLLNQLIFETFWSKIGFGFENFLKSCEISKRSEIFFKFKLTWKMVTFLHKNEFLTGRSVVKGKIKSHVAIDEDELIHGPSAALK